MWEYKNVAWDALRTKREAFDAELTALGAEGWEAVGIAPMPGDRNHGYTVLLKRPAH